MCSYRQLLLWQQACSLVGEIYQSTNGVDADGRGDLVESLRKVAIAIPVQIATHYSCDATGCLRGLERARRALVRLEHLVYLAQRLNYWPTPRAARIIRQLAGLRRHLRALFHSLQRRERVGMPRAGPVDSYVPCYQ